MRDHDATKEKAPAENWGALRCQIVGTKHLKQLRTNQMVNDLLLGTHVSLSGCCLSVLLPIIVRSSTPNDLTISTNRGGEG